jgi:hypothetical protein
VEQMLHIFSSLENLSRILQIIYQLILQQSYGYQVVSSH